MTKIFWYLVLKILSKKQINEAHWPYDRYFVFFLTYGTYNTGPHFSKWFLSESM